MNRLILPSAFRPRNSHVRHMIDPRGRLPQVEAVHDYGESFKENTYEIKYAGWRVGEFGLGLREDGNSPTVHFNGIQRNSDFLVVKGIGLATYLLLIESYGTQFGSDKQLSDFSLDMWRRLCAFGVATCVEEPVTIQTPTPFKHIDAYFRATC